MEAAHIDMRPCRACGRTDMRRMYALMALWFGTLLEHHVEGGYFYLCPTCYDTLIVPHLQKARDSDDG